MRAAVSGMTLALVAAGPMAAANPGGHDGDQATAGDERVRVLVTYKQNPKADALKRIKDLGGKVKHTYRAIPVLSLDVPERAIARLKADPAIQRVSRDAVIKTFDHGPDTGDLEYENAWGVEHIGVPRVHAAGITGQGIKVAVIDSGIDYLHDDPDNDPYVVDPEFNGTYAGGYDFVNQDDDPYDDNGHGTHVSGIIAAEKNGYLVSGVAPGVDLYALKVIGADGSGLESDLIAALQWSIDHDIDVVNMSVGTHTVVPELQAMVQQAYAAGVTMVGASGNVNPLDFWELIYGCPVVYPAAYPQVIATTFTNENDQLTGYSCTGPQVDVAAPGDGILSAVPTSCPVFLGICSETGYNWLSGTSMASPHVAGLAALILSAGITDAGDIGTLADDVRAHIRATAHQANMSPSDSRYPNWYGAGRIDAGRALIDVPPPGSGGPANAAPVATDDTASTSEETPVTVNVLGNDTDADGDTLTVTAFTQGAHGTVTSVAGGLRYAPAAQWSGTDTFGYTASDGSASDTATVTVTVSGTPDPPVAVNDNATTNEDTAVTVSVLANDSDPDGDAITLVSVQGAVKGSVVTNPDGTATFTPAANAFGTGSFGYTISDGTATASATVTVTITSVNDVPTASALSASTTSPASVQITLQGADVETCELSFAMVDLPDNGGVGSLTNFTCTPGTTGGTDTARVTYTPTAGYSGTDTFTYRVSDGSATSAQATVTVTIAPAQPPPATIHIGDLDGARSTSGKSWQATVTIRVDNGSHGAAAGATATGSWSGAATGTASCTANASGVCTVSIGSLPKNRSSITFTVTSVTLAGSTYTAAANHDPDGSSNGTAITVLR